MQHPTITVENGGLKINDERVFSLWIRLNEMAADDPVAAWAVAEIRALANTQRAAVESEQRAMAQYQQLRNEVWTQRDVTEIRGLFAKLREVVLEHDRLLGVADDSEV